MSNITIIEVAVARISAFVALVYLAWFVTKS